MRARPVKKLLVFIEENHSLDQMKVGMPHTYALARRFGYATDYHAVTHPSLPNYLAITGGQTFGVTDDDPPASHPVQAASVFGAALRNGRTAAAYADGMLKNCAVEDGGDGYAVKHNPWAYFVTERPGCQRYDVPLDALATDVAAGSLPDVGLVTPNLCHDAHDCGLDVADSWFAGWMKRIFAGPDWRSGRLAVVLTADEDDRSGDNTVLTVVIHPSQHHNVVSAPLNHYALTRLYAEVAHTTPPFKAADAPSLADSFGLRIANK
ncbi:alkaline phosphatase family protein [Nocardioides iriomotensis]|uniref:alkaline phosphatase family protein n=1 Tax=Nocardioides iriomotensis TaxID=715784 RepID=UPI001F0E7AC4|nr:alkaline phosphatase family protein [Nocardioides iriomotensis]